MKPVGTAVFLMLLFVVLFVLGTPELRADVGGKITGTVKDQKNQ